MDKRMDENMKTRQGLALSPARIKNRFQIRDERASG